MAKSMTSYVNTAQRSPDANNKLSDTLQQITDSTGRFPEAGNKTVILVTFRNQNESFTTNNATKVGPSLGLFLRSIKRPYMETTFVCLSET
jgi:hypothetical protein